MFLLICIMNLTGLKNFSIPVQHALTNDSYKGGALTDISVTGLIDSARIKQLRKLYSHEITENASRRIASLLGTAFHQMMEENSPDDWIKEERFYAEVDGLMLSGQIDAVVPIDKKQLCPVIFRRNRVIADDFVVHGETSGGDGELLRRRRPARGADKSFRRRRSSPRRKITIAANDRFSQR